MYRGTFDTHQTTRFSSINIDVIPDTNILENNIENNIFNSQTSIYTIFGTPSTDGVLTAVDKFGNEKYLAGNETEDWPSRTPIMITYMMSDENSFNLKYSNTGTFHELIILEHGGIY